MKCPNCGHETQPAAGLTERQAKLLRFIREYRSVTGISPSMDDMREAMGANSTSDIHRMVVVLQERGHITRLPRRARSIEILS